MMRTSVCVVIVVVLMSALIHVGEAAAAPKKPDVKHAAPPAPSAKLAAPAHHDDKPKEDKQKEDKEGHDHGASCPLCTGGLKKDCLEGLINDPDFKEALHKKLPAIKEDEIKHFLEVLADTNAAHPYANCLFPCLEAAERKKAPKAPKADDHHHDAPKKDEPHHAEAPKAPSVKGAASPHPPPSPSASAKTAAAHPAPSKFMFFERRAMAFRSGARMGVSEQDEPCKRSSDCDVRRGEFCDHGRKRCMNPRVMCHNEHECETGSRDHCPGYCSSSSRRCKKCSKDDQCGGHKHRRTCNKDNGRCE